MIKFCHVYLKYIKDFFTLYDINFEINKNTLFFGNRADGTSSILRLISKIDKKYEGEIFIDNINLRELNDRQLNLAYVSENAYLFKHKSIFENLYYPLKIRKINKKDAKNLINSYIDQFKIEFFSKKIKQLTYSEQKIVTLLRALIRKPKYILIENFITDLDKEYLDLACKIIHEIEKFSIIIACEKSNSNIECFNDYNHIVLENGSIKK